MEDPLDPIFAEPEKLEGEKRARLAKLIVPFVAVNPESGAVFFKHEAEKLNTKQRVLVFLLSRLALSTRNPAFSAALSPKDIEEETDFPGGTLRPKLSQLVKERCVFYDADGKYSVRISDLARAHAVLEDALVDEVKTKPKSEVEISYPQPRIKGVAELLDFMRKPEWGPEIVNTALLKRLRIGSNYESKVIQAVKFLGLVDNEGHPTAESDELKKNYQATLERLIKKKYSALFKILPPRLLNQNRLVGFFGEPTESAEYKAQFFSWLCQQAGIELPNMDRRMHRSRFDKSKEASDE